MSSQKQEPEQVLITTLLTELSIAHRAKMEKAVCDIGLHSGQVQILLVLWESDGLSQANLAAKLQVAAPTINKMVKRLALTGFVTNKCCPVDGRLKRVHLTKRGYKIRLDVEKQLKNLEQTILDGFSETEAILAPILLKRIITNLQ